MYGIYIRNWIHSLLINFLWNTNKQVEQRKASCAPVLQAVNWDILQKNVFDASYRSAISLLFLRREFLLIIPLCLLHSAWKSCGLRFLFPTHLHLKSTAVHTNAASKRSRKIFKSTDCNQNNQQRCKRYVSLRSRSNAFGK